MDVLSHALWGYAALRWRGPQTARWGAAIGATPDLLYSGAAMIRRVVEGGLGAAIAPAANNDPAIWRRDGPPLTAQLVRDYEDFYVLTHSFVLLLFLAAGLWLVWRRPPWALLAWVLHIAMDIPSHERYLTPLLYPLSDVTVMGVSWSTPPILIANFGGLAIAYGLVYWHYWRRNRPRRTTPWPEAAG